MIPPAFEYLRPATISEAIGYLQQYGEDAKILSGGQSLVPMMKLRLARPGFLIDINRIGGLAYIREEGGYLRIGGLTREAELESSELIRSKYPIIHDTASVIADPQVRNLATVGGNLAHGDPANDHPATMLALGAQVVATGPRGERVVPIEDFFVSLFTTSLEPAEILSEIRIPVAPAHSGGAYLKLERKVGDFATAAVAAYLVLHPNTPKTGVSGTPLEGGVVQKAGIGLTNVGPTPLKARKAEDFLRGKKADDANLQEASQLAAGDAQPSTDLRGPAEYKKGLVRELAYRALVRARERAGG